MCESNLSVTGTGRIDRYEFVAEGIARLRLVREGSVIATQKIIEIPASIITDDPWVAGAVLQSAFEQGQVEIVEEA